MTLKYVVNKWDVKIDKVCAEKETEKSIWLNGIRTSKITQYHQYFDSWDAASGFLIEKYSSRLISARLGLVQAQGEYGNAKGLKNPDEE